MLALQQGCARQWPLKASSSKHSRHIHSDSNLHGVCTACIVPGGVCYCQLDALRPGLQHEATGCRCSLPFAVLHAWVNPQPSESLLCLQKDPLLVVADAAAPAAQPDTHVAQQLRRCPAGLGSEQLQHLSRRAAAQGHGAVALLTMDHVRMQMQQADSWQWASRCSGRPDRAEL